MGKTKRADVCFSGFWVLLGLYVALVSYRLGLGNLQCPGGGFTPFFFGLILSGFSLINLVVGLSKENEKGDARGQRYSLGTYGKVGVMIGSLLAYGIFVETVGFLIMTAVVMISLFRIAGCKWTISVIWGPVIACLSYFVFIYLGVMLPAGILRF